MSIMPRTWRSVSFLIAVTSCGCGTMANIDGRRLPSSSPSGQEVSRPFGGIRKDIEWVKTAKSPGNLMFVADLPLSLVGDIVTLPKTVTGMQSDNLLQDNGPDHELSSFGSENRQDLSEKAATSLPGAN
jgi:hypothetical protein